MGEAMSGSKRRSIASCALALVALLALGACAPTQQPAPGSAAPQAEGEQRAAVESSALVIYADEDTVLLVDRDNGAVYFPTVPEDGLFDAEGNAISAADLQPGNVVWVQGNGIMLESYPGQYPGIFRMQVTETGSPADAEAYADVVAQVIVEPDENEVPTGSLAYTTSLASVSVVLQPGSYTWVVKADGEERTVAADAAFSDADGVLASELADARIAEAVDAELLFSMKPTSVKVSRTPLSTAVDGTMSIELATGYDDVPAALAPDGASTLRIEPGYLYVAQVQFQRGEALYPFIAAKQG